MRSGPTAARTETGAALLGAMLVLTLVASLASGALWLQWRQVELEAAERTRAQSLWLMTGVMDWTRLILSEDARSGQSADHLGEPWALPVQESKLSTFLSQDHQWREGDPEVFLSGQIVDAQSRLNLTALLVNGRPSPAQQAAWTRLFARLELPPSELQLLLQRWPQVVAASERARTANTSSTASAGASAAAANMGDTATMAAPLLPQRLEQLAWLGLQPGTLERLRPYATVLPLATPVNLNTADPVVLEAVVPGLSSADARQWVMRRNSQPWMTLQEAAQALGPQGGQLDPALHAVRSRYFEIQGRLRIAQTVQHERALVEREGGQTRMLWRTRASLPGPLPPSLQ